MDEQAITILGVVIPTRYPPFLWVLGVHIPMALICVVSGVVAMRTRKTWGPHTHAGSIYFWALTVVVATSTVLALMRWSQSWPLFVLGIVAWLSAFWGRATIRRRPRSSDGTRSHILGMGASYIVLLVAFYVDNGKNLPLWKELPPLAYWLLPPLVGLPIMARAVRGVR